MFSGFRIINVIKGRQYDIILPSGTKVKVIWERLLITQGIKLCKNNCKLNRETKWNYRTFLWLKRCWQAGISGSTCKYLLQMLMKGKPPDCVAMTMAILTTIATVATTATETIISSTVKELKWYLNKLCKRVLVEKTHKRAFWLADWLDRPTEK